MSDVVAKRVSVKNDVFIAALWAASRAGLPMKEVNKFLAESGAETLAEGSIQQKYHNLKKRFTAEGKADALPVFRRGGKGRTVDVAALVAVAEAEKAKA